MNAKIEKIFWGISDKLSFILDTMCRRLKKIPDKYLAVGAIIKNEGPYIKEWLDFHIAMGVECFYLYDNNSTDDTRKILAPYISEGKVFYHKIGGKQRQRRAYNQIAKLYSSNTFWIAYIDADEFLYCMPKDGKKIDLKDFLKGYEDYNGVGVNWLMFGTSGNKTKPEGNVVDNYTRCIYDYEPNLHIKTIANAKKVKLFYNTPHTCEFIDGNPAVDENKELLLGNEEIDIEQKKSFSKKLNVNKIVLNHYYTKSEKEFFERCHKGKASGSLDPMELYNNWMNMENSSEFVDNFVARDLIRQSIDE